MGVLCMQGGPKTALGAARTTTTTDDGDQVLDACLAHLAALPLSPVTVGAECLRLLQKGDHPPENCGEVCDFGLLSCLLRTRVHADDGESLKNDEKDPIGAAGISRRVAKGLG